MSKARNAGCLKLNMPPMNSYKRVSSDQEAIEGYLKQHGARQLTIADNTGKMGRFNGEPKQKG